MIFLDMDGVLCDFISAALEAHGRIELLQSWPAGEWEIAKVLGCTTGEFWRSVDHQGEHFWSGLQPYGWARELAHLAARYGETLIASTPSESHHSAAGKVLWLERHFPGWFPASKRTFTARKDLIARPGRLLVDDSDRNVSAWIAAGGEAVLFPQPWNSLGEHFRTDEARFRYVREQIYRLRGAE